MDRWLGRIVDAVLLMEWWCRLERLGVNRLRVRIDHLHRARRQQWLPGCCRYLHLRRIDGENVIPVATLSAIADARLLCHLLVLLGGLE